MKKAAATLLLFIFSVNYSIAQQSIGFSNPENIQPILDYRLPDWGYSNFLLDFNFNGDGFFTESQSVPSSRRSTNFNLNPGYTFIRESEERIFELRANGVFGYNGDYQKIETTLTGQKFENDTDNIRTIFSINPLLKEYVNRSVFVYGRTPFTLDYRRLENLDKTDGSITDNRVSIDRRITATPRIGIGFGRVRNVTPIIRAIRLSERLKTVNSGINFNEGDIQSSADQFTRLEGYQRNYDRPSKYFWSDLNDVVSTDLEKLDAFDMLYLTDVLNEALGSRREGWEVITGIAFEYDNTLLRDEEEVNQPSPSIVRSTTINKLFGGFVSARWYKNTSLKTQWGLFGDLELQYSMDDEINLLGDLKRNLVVSGGVNLLYNISDRFLFESALSNRYFRTKFEDGVSGPVPPGTSPEFNQWVNDLELSSSLNYFVENKMVINISVSPSLRHRGNSVSDNRLESRTFYWQVGAGLCYYFQRNLF